MVAARAGLDCVASWLQSAFPITPSCSRVVLAATFLLTSPADVNWGHRWDRIGECGRLLVSGALYRLALHPPAHAILRTAMPAAGR
jgi:hypothetical protein